VAHRRPGLEGALVLTALAIAITGCGATPKQAGEENAFDTTPKEGSSANPDTSAAPAKSETPPADKGEREKLTNDQEEQIKIALRRGGEKAANCASVVPDGPRGEGEVTVNFDGKKGRAVDATVGAPFAGTPMEACIKRSFVGEIIVPFEGSMEVPYTIRVGPKVEDPKAKGKDPKGKKK
jgi:hypothetical protein